MDEQYAEHQQNFHETRENSASNELHLMNILQTSKQQQQQHFSTDYYSQIKAISFASENNRDLD